MSTIKRTPGTDKYVLRAAQTGDEVATLEALRDLLAETLDGAPVNVVGNLAPQLAAVLKRLAELKPSGKVTLSDALAERREARASSAEPAPSAKRPTKRAG